MRKVLESLEGGVVVNDLRTAKEPEKGMWVPAIGERFRIIPGIGTGNIYRRIEPKHWEEVEGMLLASCDGTKVNFSFDRRGMLDQFEEVVDAPDAGEKLDCGPGKDIFVDKTPAACIGDDGVLRCHKQSEEIKRLRDDNHHLLTKGQELHDKNVMLDSNNRKMSELLAIPVDTTDCLNCSQSKEVRRLADENVALKKVMEDTRLKCLACGLSHGCTVSSLQRELTKAVEEGRKDYDGMRDMQRKFIKADHELRELKESLAGNSEDDVCGRYGCKGVMAYPSPRNCTCHTGNAPCGACTEVVLTCSECGFEVNT